MTRGQVAIVNGGGAGGVERFSALLARALERRGWSAELVSPRQAPSRWVARFAGGSLQSSHRLGRDLARLAPDLVVSNGPLGALHRGARPRIHVYHGTMVGHTLADVGTPVRQRVRALVGDATAEALSGRGATTVAVSDAARREVERWLRVRVDAVIPNGVDTECFRPRDRRSARASFGLRHDVRYALFVGRIEGRKGGDLLRPSTAAAGWELVVAGPAGVPGARHLGALAPARLAEAYAAADCVLFPTRYEGCSFVVLEALASGTPLVTTAVGWMPEFLREVPEYGRLVVEPDVRAVAARLRMLEADCLGGLTAAAREWIAAHNGLAVFDEAWGELVDAVASPVGRRDPVLPPGP